MKKKNCKLLSLLIITLLFVSCVTDKIKNDLTKDNFLGKVKSVREFTYDPVEKFGKIIKREISKRYGNQTKFNENGNQIEINRYNSDGRLNYKKTYKYDDRGYKTETNEYGFYGSLRGKSTYEYDDKGNQTKENNYNSDGSLDYQKTYEYDDKGNKTKQISDGYLNEKWTYEYDDKGNLTDYKNYFHDSLKYIFSLKYDDNGNNTEWNKYNSNGSFYMKSSLKYDDKRNLTELNSYRPDGSINFKITNKYEFDQVGNWTKQIQSKGAKPTYVKEREIEYYN
jgi:hypothetical protein